MSSSMKGQLRAGTSSHAHDGPPSTEDDLREISSEGRPLTAPFIPYHAFDRSHPAALVTRPARPIHEVMRGETVDTPHGSCYLVRSRHHLDGLHGSLPLRASLGHDTPSLLPLLTKERSFCDFDLRRAAFIDTETTGLAGGTGTYAFLVGLGYIAGDHFEVCQFFMRDFVDERAMLHAINLRCRELGLDSIVSFNGRCFDLPLLQTRYTMSRMRFGMSEPLHLDLLAPSRRVWRGRLESCTLRNIEETVIGLRRSSADVPGWLIPTLYFDYLRSGNAAPLRRVFYHNQQDIVSMLALVQHLCAAFSSPDALEYSADLLGVARCYEEQGQPQRAIAIYSLALERADGSGERAAVIARLAALHKRLGSSDEATLLWERLVAEGTPLLFPYIELAMHHEHRTRNYAVAAQLTTTACDLARRQRAKELAGIEKRLLRLEKKMQPKVKQP